MRWDPATYLQQSRRSGEALQSGSQRGQRRSHQDHPFVRPRDVGHNQPSSNALAEPSSETHTGLNETPRDIDRWLASRFARETLPIVGSQTAPVYCLFISKRLPPKKVLRTGEFPNGIVEKKIYKQVQSCNCKPYDNYWTYARLSSKTAYIIISARCCYAPRDAVVIQYIQFLCIIFLNLKFIKRNIENMYNYA
jgi:hypothetical protein